MAGKFSQETIPICTMMVSFRIRKKESLKVSIVGLKHLLENLAYRGFWKPSDGWQ
jgi:hypothetical protein